MPSIFRSPPAGAIEHLLAEAGLPVEAEGDARRHGVRRLFLLTTTAADFFGHLGYKEIAREQAPAAIRATREFTALCPSSSTLMVKEI